MSACGCRSVDAVSPTAGTTATAAATSAAAVSSTVSQEGQEESTMKNADNAASSSSSSTTISRQPQHHAFSSSNRLPPQPPPSATAKDVAYNALPSTSATSSSSLESSSVSLECPYVPAPSNENDGGGYNDKPPPVAAAANANNNHHRHHHAADVADDDHPFKTTRCCTGWGGGGCGCGGGGAFWTELHDLLGDLIHYGRTKTWKKKIMTVLLCLSSLLVFYDLLFGTTLVTWLHSFVLWTTDHTTWAVFAFVAIFVVSTLLFIPPTLLVFGAGYAFTVAIGTVPGVLAATLSCFLGSCIGAMISFLRSRYMMRDLIYVFAKRYPLVRAADRALKRNGFRLMLLLRACPVIPFNGLNHCCGITGVSLHDFTLSMVGVLPFYVYTIMLGATTASLADNLRQDVADNTRAQLVAFVIVMVSGTLFGLIAMVYAWRLVKRELKRELHLTSEEFETLVHPHNDAASDHATVGGDTLPVGGGGDSGHDPILHHHHSEENDVEHGCSIEAGLFRDDGEEWYWVWA